MNEIIDLKVKKKRVSNRSRIHALPRNFKNYFLQYESACFSYADMFIEGYNGGYWEFYQLSNGGFFMCLSPDQNKIKVSFPNYFEALVTKEIAGIIISMYVYSNLHMVTNDDLFAIHYQKLEEYIKQLPDEDHDTIKAALD